MATLPVLHISNLFIVSLFEMHASDFHENSYNSQTNVLLIGNRTQLK